MEKISDVLANIKHIKAKDNKISIGDILENNSENAYFLMVLITIMSFLPFIFVIIFGSMDVYICAQIFAGRKIIKLPKAINNISIGKRFLVKTINKINPIVIKIEKLMKHRLVKLFKKRNLHIIHLFMLILSMVITIPIPFSGTVPAIALLLILLGILSKDGLWVLVGSIIGIVGIVLVLTILWLTRIFFLKLFM